MTSHVRIKVIGVGGGGSNSVSRMVRDGVGGVEFIVANTDLQALRTNPAPLKLNIGSRLTKGLGAGSSREVGRQAALDDTEKIIQALDGADLVFVTAGLGGGTGNGAAPVIASLASQLGALTIGVVSTPFKFEGKKRQAQAERSVATLRDSVDALIMIPSEQILTIIDRTTPLAEAFASVDDMIKQPIQAISDLIMMSGLINPDFADVKRVMAGTGLARMGVGVAEGRDRALEAARRAISSPLLAGASIEGSRGLIVNVTSSSNMSLAEVSDASSIVQEAAHEDANIVFGGVIDPALAGKLRVTVIVTGVDSIAFPTNAVLTSPPLNAELQQSGDLGSFVVIWDPDIVSPSDYAMLVEAIGDLARAGGAVGVQRLKRQPARNRRPPQEPSHD